MSWTYLWELFPFPNDEITSSGTLCKLITWKSYKTRGISMHTAPRVRVVRRLSNCPCQQFRLAAVNLSDRRRIELPVGREGWEVMGFSTKCAYGYRTDSHFRWIAAPRRSHAPFWQFTPRFVGTFPPLIK